MFISLLELYKYLLVLIYQYVCLVFSDVVVFVVNLQRNALRIIVKFTFLFQSQMYSSLTRLSFISTHCFLREREREEETSGTFISTGRSSCCYRCYSIFYICNLLMRMLPLCRSVLSVCRCQYEK